MAKMSVEQKVEEAVQITIRQSQELGRTPLKQELYHEITRYTIDKFCGGYDKLLEMAGLHPMSYGQARSLPKKINNTIFQQPVPEELQNKIVASHRVEKTILIAGDMHLPWVHQPTLDAFYEFNRIMKPDYVIQIGDLYDMYAHSRFAKSQNLYTPKEEEKRARAGAEAFWNQIHTDNPTSRKIQFKGNHDIRPIKQTQERLPAIEHFVEAYMERLFTFDNVQTVEDHREIVRIEGVAFHHGYLGGLGSHRDSVLENIVVGHTHMGGVSYRGIRGQTLFELNAGFMGDPSSKVMSYTPAKEDKQTLGFGFIDKYGARFIAT